MHAKLLKNVLLENIQLSTHRFQSLHVVFSNGEKVSSNPRGTKNVFSVIRVLSMQLYMYVLSLSYLAMGINLVRDKGPRD